MNTRARTELILKLRAEASATHKLQDMLNDAADMLQADARQPLTDDEIDEAGVDFKGEFKSLRDFARVIEAKIKDRT